MGGLDPHVGNSKRGILVIGKWDHGEVWGDWTPITETIERGHNAK